MRTIGLDAEIQPLRAELAGLPKEIPDVESGRLTGHERPLCMEDYMMSLTSMRPAGGLDPRYEEWTQKGAL